MFWDAIFKSILFAFAVRHRVDYVLRPMVMLAGVAVVNFAVKVPLTGLSGTPLVMDTAMTLMVAFPFVVICYALLLYQSKVQRNLSTEAQTDELTGLPNRRAFFRRAERALANDANGFFLILDADHFKRVNDTLGHQSGDVCLQAIADRIKSVLRPDDLVGRIGGEEFGIVFLDRTMEDLQRLAGRICFPIKVSLPGHPEPLRLTLSAGATEISANDNISLLTSRADEALIAAKNNGRERMVLWRRNTAKNPAA